jgi:thiol:disulfide interchange protein DsbD
MNYACLLRFVTAIVLTFPLAAAGARAAAPKPADQAFQLQVLLDDEDNLELSWSIAPGHYLYRSRISAKLDGKPLALVMPHG